jgi:four helix bundle protein
MGNCMDRTEFENLRIYQLAEELADLAWKVVGTWGRLAQETVGIQLIRSADSIGANIAEGSGRGSPAEKRRFAKIARGSLFEVKHWLRRAYKRQLLGENEVKVFQKLIEELTPKLSAYINSENIKGRLATCDRQPAAVCKWSDIGKT